MAIPAVSTADESKIVQLIVFHVGNEEFGVPIGEVREIIKTGPVTPIPDSPNFVGGLINVRGDIVATIDLRTRFSMRATDASELKHTVITRQGENLFGLMVNEVTEVLRVPETEIKDATDLVLELDDDYVRGVLPFNNRLIILLDLARVLSERAIPTKPGESINRFKELESTGSGTDILSPPRDGQPSSSEPAGRHENSLISPAKE